MPVPQPSPSHHRASPPAHRLVEADYIAARQDVANVYSLAGQFLVGSVLLGSASLAYSFTSGISVVGEVISIALWTGAVGAGIVCLFTFFWASRRRRSMNRQDLTGDPHDLERAVDTLSANNALAHQCERALLLAVAIPAAMTAVGQILGRIAPDFAVQHGSIITAAFVFAAVVAAFAIVIVGFDYE